MVRIAWLPRDTARFRAAHGDIPHPPSHSLIMSTPATIPVVFDCLGTLFAFDKAIHALRDTFSDQLDATAATSIIEDWFHSSQRDFTVRSVRLGPTPPAPLARIIV